MQICIVLHYNGTDSLNSGFPSVAFRAPLKSCIKKIKNAKSGGANKSIPGQVELPVFFKL